MSNILSNLFSGTFYLLKITHWIVYLDMFDFCSGQTIVYLDMFDFYLNFVQVKQCLSSPTR